MSETQITFAPGVTATLTFHSINGRNPIGSAALADLSTFCAEIADMQPRPRAVVVTGGHLAFSSGWSAELLAFDRQEDPFEALPVDPFGCLAALPVPVIAAIEGDCFSAGLELALACDLRVCGAAARFAFPETEFGLIPLAGGTQRLPRVVGRGAATAMILLGRVVDSVSAADWGLVNEVVPAGTALQKAVELAEVIAARGPVAEAFAKEAIADGIELPLDRALRYELDLTVLLQATLDRAEGVRAFAEKRSPRFTGQ